MSALIGNPLLLPGEGYQISRSVRLRSSASASFTRTPGSASSLTTWTWSGWAKRGALSNAVLFAAGPWGGTQNYTWITFSSDQLTFDSITPGPVVVGRKFTTAVFRDPSAWYHIVAVWDTTNATAADRMRLYVNGTRITSFSLSTDPASSAVSLVNTTNLHYLAREGNAGSYFDGYLTEINFIDGQALTPSAFGETDAITGVWKPKKYVGTYGTNGFYLNFSDNSAATAAAIGKDYSGNGNNWTPNNISVTAGATYDSMLDVPTPWADGGNGRGNYSVFNAIKPYGGAVTLSNGNLTVSHTNNYTVDTSIGVSSGQYYCELTATTVATRVEFGVAQNYNWAVNYRSDGQKNVNGTLSAYGATWTSGDVIGMAFDIGAGSVTFYKNGVSQGTITGVTYYSADNFVTAYGIAGSAYSINFGQRPFAYTPPTGFKALHTGNLPAGSITTSGSFTGNANADGPFIYLNGVPTAMTINGNAVTFGTHADKTANGFKVRSSSTSYNSTGSNTYSITTTGAKFKYANAQGNP